MGSGTTAAVAKSMDRHYIGCELHRDYAELILQRLDEVAERRLEAPATPLSHFL